MSTTTLKSSTSTEETTAFDPANAYLPWEVNGQFHSDGRELALLDYIFSHPSLPSIRNNPSAILSLIDNFARTHTGLINIGATKGSLITNLIAKHHPSSILEFGGYIGYSAILFGAAMRDAGGSTYVSVEKSPLFAAVAGALIELAGLRKWVRVVIGTGSEGIDLLNDEGVMKSGPWGMVFFDHHKPSYTADLKKLEEYGGVGRGTVLVADNMILPGNPPYAEWVRGSFEEKQTLKEKAVGDGGRPELVYRSRFVKSFEPSGQVDGIEITECDG